MRKIHIQLLAEQDIRDIWLYSFRKWGEVQADKYFDELTNAINSIPENPHIGIACDYIREGYRQLHVNHHMVFYRITAEKIIIVRVLGESMDYKRHIR